jgi:hypothetical protein
MAETECEKAECLKMLRSKRITPLEAPNLIDYAMNAAQSWNAEIVEAAFTCLRDIACAPEWRFRLFETTLLVDFALTAASSGETDGIVSAALALLANLSLHRENAVALFARPTLVGAAVSAVKLEKTTDIRYMGLVLLNHFAFIPENAVQLFAVPDLVDLVLKSAESGPTDEIKTAAFQILQCLALPPDHREALFNTPRLVEVALGAATGAALSLIANLASSPNNSAALLVLLPAALTAGGTSAAGLQLLVNISSTSTNKETLMMREPNLCKIALEASTSGATSEIRRAGLALLVNLTRPSAPPPPPADVKGWLERAGMGKLHPAFVKQGVVSMKRLSSLAKMRAPDIKAILEISGGDAMDLEAALKKGRWEE